MENQKEEYIKYSVIIPVYNCEKFIIRCIESFLKQKNKKMEIIVVDDGSKDNTLKILNEAYSDNSFVRIFNKKNTGVSDSRNFGIRKARGKYILFSDSDDYVEEKYFKKIIFF